MTGFDIGGLGSLEFWRTFTLAVAAVGQTAFVALYATFPWYRTFLGRALFYKALTLGLLTDFVLLSRIFDFGHEDRWYALFYALLAVAVWGQFLAFLVVRRQSKEQSLADAHQAVRDAEGDMMRKDGPR